MKQLPSPESPIGPAARPATLEEQLESARKAILILQGELAGARDNLARCEERYNKLSDIWMAFQGTAKPLQRNVHRAEAAGELCRKLAEVFLGLAYDTSTMQDLLKVLQELAHPTKETGLVRR